MRADENECAVSVSILWSSGFHIDILLHVKHSEHLILNERYTDLIRFKL